MIDKSCGYKMASGSESDSGGPPSSLGDFLLKIQDAVGLFHRLPAADAREAARALQDVANHLCLATDVAVSLERRGETSSDKGALSPALSRETQQLPSLPSVLQPPNDDESSGLVGLVAAGPVAASGNDSQPQWRRQRQSNSDCRRRTVKGHGAVRKQTSLAPEQQAVLRSDGGAPATPTIVATHQTPLLTPPPQTTVVSATSPANSCSHCGKHFSCAAKLVEHRRTHTGERPFVCQICNRAFSVKSNMTRHVVDTHGLKDAAAGRCGRRARLSLGRSDSSGINNGGGDDFSFPPSLLPSSTQSSVNHGSDEDEPGATDLRKRPAPESPVPQKFARNGGEGEGLTIHRFNRRKSQPRKLDSVICLLRNSMPCTADEADDTHTDHSDAGGFDGEEDGGGASGCHDRDRNILSATIIAVTDKHNGVHPLDIRNDSQRLSAVAKPRNASNGSGHGEELWLSCDRSFRQASPC